MNIKEISIEVENGNNVDISLERRNVTTDMSLVEKAYSDYNFTYNEQTGKLELTLIANDKRAKTIKVDLPTEELVKDISYDIKNKEINVEWQNGETYKISLKEFIDIYKADNVTLLLDEETKTFRINEEYLTASNIKVDPKKANVQATNVESAIKELKDDIQETANEIKDGVVTGIKGSNEDEYRKGQVEITKENIGLGNVLNVGSYSKEESDNKYQVQGDYATRSEIPTTLPASDVYSWAKEPTKPSYDKSEIGLSNVDNTSDIDKPISTDVQNALDLKEDKSNLKALAYKDSLNKSDVGLDKVNNVSITEQEVAQIGTNKTDIATLNQKVGNLTGSFQFKGELGSIQELPTANSSNAGYVYIIGNLEYVSDGSKWIELGDEGSFVLKTTYESHLLTQANKDSSQDTEIETIKNNYAKKDELFTKNYDDLLNKPEIPSKTSQLENDSEYVNNQELTNAIDKFETEKFEPAINNLRDDIPTKTSQLTNDSNYATTSQLFSKNYNDLTNKPSIPTSTSQLTNNSGFITNAVNNLTNYYLKSETYTKSEVQQLLSTISSLKLEVVTNLPTTNISSNTIYLKPLDSAKENNIYEEYIYINSKWETIGTTAVDLSNYALKADIPKKTSQLTNDSGFLTEHQDISGKANKNEVVDLTSDQTISGNKTFETIKIKYPDKDNFFQISPDGNGNTVKFKLTNNVLMMLHNGGITNYRNILPDTNNTRNLGSSSASFKNAYIRGYLSDGTNNVSVSDIANKSDITNLISRIEALESAPRSSGTVYNDYY